MVGVTVPAVTELTVKSSLPSVRELIMSVKLVLTSVASAEVPLVKLYETEGIAIFSPSYQLALVFTFKCWL